MFKVGDQVYCQKSNSSGVITYIRNKGNYPIDTSFNRTYTLDGKEYMSDETPYLFKQVFTPPASQPTTQHSIKYSSTHIFINDLTIYPLASAFINDYKLMDKFLLTPNQLREFIQHISPQIKELT